MQEALGIVGELKKLVSARELAEDPAKAELSPPASPIGSSRVCVLIDTNGYDHDSAIRCASSL